MVKVKEYLKKFLPASDSIKAPESMTLVTRFDQEKYIIDISRRSVTIGRNETNDVVIPDGRVSKLHCRIDFEEGRGFNITDYSRNGTFICNPEKTNIIHLSKKTGWFQIPRGQIYLGIHPRSGINSTTMEFTCS